MRTLLPTLRPSLAARRLGVRLALFALLAAAMVPTFSRLLQPVGLSDWAALCQTVPASGSSQDQHANGDACALCSIAHTTPALGGQAHAPVAVLAYAPPAPPAPAAVRTQVVQARAPSARAPPAVA